MVADEQYANGTGPVYSATTPSAVAGTTLWAVADHLGSARDLVDNNGIVRKHVVFDSFGKRSGEVNRDAAGTVLPALSPLAVDTAFGYTGADWDGDVGLTNHDARWYDSSTGRWLSQDPIGFAAGDPNLYRYVGNTPMTKMDPSGLEERPYIVGPDGRPFPIPFNAPYPPETVFPRVPYHPPYDGPSVGQWIPPETWQDSARRKGYSVWTIMLVEACRPGGGFDQVMSVMVTPAIGVANQRPRRGNLPPRYSGNYEDGDQAYRTDFPIDKNARPIAGVQGYAHSRVQYDSVDGVRIYSMTEFDAHGNPVCRVDFAGRRGHPVPHEHIWNGRNFEKEHLPLSEWRK